VRWCGSSGSSVGMGKVGKCFIGVYDLICLAGRMVERKKKDL